jgi:hypothetical protein
MYKEVAIVWTDPNCVVAVNGYMSREINRGRYQLFSPRFNEMSNFGNVHDEFRYPKAKTMKLDY